MAIADTADARLLPQRAPLWRRAVRLRSLLLLLPIAAWLGLFLLGPLGIMFVYSLWKADFTTFSIIREWNLDAYESIFTNSLYLDIIGKSLWLGAIVVAFTIVLGFPTAYLLASRKSDRAKMVLLLLMLVPFWTSVLLRSYAWILVLEEHGAVNSLLTSVGVVDKPITWLLFNKFAIVLSLVQLYLPFMVIPVYAVLEKFDWTLLEAAKDLRAGKLQAFVNVTLPAALPGLLIGFLLVFIPSVSAYITPTLLGGTEGLMVSGLIASQFGTAYNWPLGAALSFVIVVLLLAIVFLLMKVVRPWDLFERGAVR